MPARLQAVELGLSGQWPVPTVVACAEEADRCGFRRFWVAENYYARSLSVLATAVCRSTRRIDVGLGVVNPFTRLAPLIAMETATLDELSGGRVTLAIGAGRMPANHLGLDQTKTITLLRETVEICRRLFAGETLGYQGAVIRIPPGAVRLGVHPARGGALPIYLGTMGPKGQRLGGEIADGVFLSVFTSPALARAARSQIETGLRQSGRALTDIYFGTYALFAVDRDRRVARDLVRPTVADYLGRHLSTERLIAAGIAPDSATEVRAAVRAALAAGQTEDAIRLVPDEFCDKLSVCGTPDDCCAALQALAEAGLQSVTAYNMLGRDPVHAIRCIAREIVPQICAP
jgi:5,10-methylenetetrahydromethanopterin reductase